eukprot:4511886-Amphidinium_carterae.1
MNVRYLDRKKLSFHTSARVIEREPGRATLHLGAAELGRPKPRCAKNCSTRCVPLGLLSH